MALPQFSIAFGVSHPQCSGELGSSHVFRNHASLGKEYRDSRQLHHHLLTFSFIISSEGADSYSNGLTFFLASPDFPPPIPIDGSSIGLVSHDQMKDSSFLAANKFIAMEFDTFQNDEPKRDPSEPVREHVGININDMKSRNTTTWHSVLRRKEHTILVLVTILAHKI